MINSFNCLLKSVQMLRGEIKFIEQCLDVIRFITNLYSDDKSNLTS